MKEVLILGQSLWYDGLIARPELERMIHEDGLRGATTNPVIFEKALNGGEYDSQIADLTKQGCSDEEIYKTLAIKTVKDVADAFLPVWQKTAGTDGYVSIEVSPLLAYDTEGTVSEAKELFSRAASKNVMIKIPATEAGLPAIERVIAEGIPVNVTLIFSVDRHREVMEAFLSGLERRSDKKQPLNQIASVASFFVSRVDSAVDKILEAKIKSTNEQPQKELYSSLLGRVAIANSKVAYAAFEETFATDRFLALKKEGAQVQRPLWASTGTKNPAFSDVLYVESLIGPNTVDTVPPATLAAFRDHGKAELTLTEGLAESEKILEKLAFAQIALSEVTAELERAGVELFKEAYEKIIQRIKDKRQ